MKELDRVRFVAKRDGYPAANEFAWQTYRIYRNWLYGPKRIRNPDYRDPVLRSLIELRGILRDPQLG